MFNSEFGDIKCMLLNEYKKQQPSEAEITAFIKGMSWFEDVMVDRYADDRLNEYLPLRVENRYLSESLAQLRGIEDENETLKEQNQKLYDHQETWYHLSQKEKFKIKREKEYQALEKENASLNKYRDMYYELILRLRGHKN